MNKLFQPLFKRRSVRHFTSERIPNETIKELLEVAMAAPSARCMDPWHFTCFGGDFCQEVVPALSNGQVLVSANNGILVCADMDRVYDKELSFALQDCSAAIENTLLAASMKGLGTCWMGIHPRVERIEAARDIFNLPEHLLPVSIIALGVPAEEHEARTRYDESKVFWM